MNAKKVAVIFILVSSVGLVFWLYNTRQAKENSDNSGQENSVTASTQDYPESSAISKAKERSGQNPQFVKLRQEASQFGLTLMSWEEDEYKQIRNRLLTNDQLASALKTVASEKVQVGLSHNFRIKANAVDINVDASDDEIIKFLLGK